MWLTDVDRSLFGIAHLMPIWMSDVGFGVYILIHFVYCVYILYIYIYILVSEVSRQQRGATMIISNGSPC